VKYDAHIARSILGAFHNCSASEWDDTDADFREGFEAAREYFADAERADIVAGLRATAAVLSAGDLLDSIADRIERGDFDGFVAKQRGEVMP
jgi:hypothetical protein